VRTDLAITGIGMLSPIGHSALVCMHSVRSAVSRLELQRLPDRTREWIAGGRVACWTPFVQTRHLEALAEIAMRQAIRYAYSGDPTGPASLAVLLGGPEAERPGYRFPPPGFSIEEWIATKGIGPVNHVEVLAGGSCSGQLALHRAAEILQSGRGDACLIGVADTQLQIRVTRWHEDNYRLKCAYLTDGLMPAEAACFLVVERGPDAARRGARVIARVLSVAGARETATIVSDRPNTAQALVAAVRRALTDAAVEPGQVGMVWSDLNGESYRAREWALTEIRLGFQTSTALMHPADCHGDLGAATDACLLGLAALCHGTGWSQDRPLLVIAGSEHGLRAATVIAPPLGAKPFVQVSAGLPQVLSETFRLPPSPAEEDFTQSANPPRAYFEWQLREEHRDELASLHYQRTAILNDPALPWRRLGEPEQRILNHLDAAVAGGSASMAAVADAVNADEVGLCFAGALMIGVLPCGENLERISTALEQPTVARLAGIQAGLLHAPPSDALDSLVRRLANDPNCAVQAMAVSVAGKRRIGLAFDAAALLGNADPNLALAGADFCRRSGTKANVFALKTLLGHVRTDVRGAALDALLCIVPSRTAIYCRSRLEANAEFLGGLAKCLAICGQLEDAELLGAHVERTPTDVWAVEALGILGAPASVPLLIELLGSSHEGAKLAAAGALNLISGRNARESVTVMTEPMVDGLDEAESREVERAMTSRDYWADWWKAAGLRLDSRLRWRLGRPFDFGSCVNEMDGHLSTLGDRDRAYLELVALARMAIPFEPDWFVPLQQSAIAEWRVWLGGK
jgi:3-oxoacyl-[acyl-carrier-protein] synthase-1